MATGSKGKVLGQFEDFSIFGEAVCAGMVDGPKGNECLSQINRIELIFVFTLVFDVTTE